MIIDSLKNASKYFLLNPNFEAAFDFIAQNNIASLPDGMTTISENLRVIVNTAQANSNKVEALQFFECHDNHIDIQVCVQGLETYAWKPREKCNQPNGEYNTEKDVRFWKDTPDTFFELTNNQFAILYPEDCHASMMGAGEIKKLIFKVKI
ncbi:YhcH/YjgK/YiaL family protein [Flavobacterium algicola]|uniref:YhcH/YjgK/YiaL family protein n=1 Tax=Flavobacterium algicola TaxID=556529 RepID=UPI001EFC57BA|nr:YhcH/YjgK/YiaL family protein [Flavobacterium algicola]MCG9793078.1 YhcH/YjgK/YiaL family protein [Flavobacterium algicola]